MSLTISTANQGIAARIGRYATTAAVIALMIQAAHFVEHIAQFGYWVAHPLEAPWMTPWGMELQHALSIGGEQALGLELLHLIANLIFLGGLGALVMMYRGRDHFGETPNQPLLSDDLRAAVKVQGVHVIEHFVLTLTVVIYGEAIGVSTFFGLVDGPVMTSWRVWFHFLINLVASWYTVRVVARTLVNSVSSDTQVGRMGGRP